MRRTVLLLASTALAVLLACGVVLVGAQERAEAAFPGANGRIVFTHQQSLGSFEREIYTMAADGSFQTRLTYNSGWDSMARWSPDGTKIAFVSERNGLAGRIYTMNADGSEQTQLTTFSAHSPTWSPDGEKIAFVGSTSGSSSPRLHVMDADGSNVTAVAGYTSTAYSPAWSPDGTKIAFEGFPPGSGISEIYTVNVDGTGLARLTTRSGEDTDPTWSPDGTKIAFVGLGVEGINDIHVIKADGSEQTNITNTEVNEAHPAWSPDGTEISFSRGAFSASEMYTMGLDGSNLTAITKNGQADEYPDWQALDPTAPDPINDPPETVLNGGPSGLTNSSTASFYFASPSDWRATFECSLDGSAFDSCASPQQYTGLADGSHTFQVRGIDPSANVDPTPASRTWSIDTTVPVAKAPTRNLVAGSAITNSTVPVNLFWSATDGDSGVARYEVQQSTNGGAFTDVALPSETATAVTPSLEAGKTYQYQVGAQDRAGNWSAWQQGPAFAVDLRQETHQAIAYTGSWTLQSSPTASGGYLRYATASGARAKFSFAGKHAAWIASTGPNRGKAEVWVDGVKAATVDLYAATAQPRKMVFVKAWATTPSANHTLEVRVLGTKNAASSGKRVDVDAFVALR